jgi:16S rRNA (guanine(966)-N(2))-methyltransferase RsmD
MVMMAMGFTACSKDEPEEVYYMYGTPTCDYKISGIVKDAKYKAIPGINVVLQKSNNGIKEDVMTITTDKDGKFSTEYFNSEDLHIDYVKFTDVDGPENGGEFEDKTFLDLFGGSGIMGLEALSRGFKSVTVFEKNPKVAQILKKNYSALGLAPNLKIGDSLKLIKKMDKNFNVIYIDPPYYSGVYNEVFELLSKYAKSTEIIIAEHTEQLHINELTTIKEKNYGGKRVSFFTLQ